MSPVPDPLTPAAMPSVQGPRSRHLPLLALCAAVLMLVLSPAQAQWKWRDASGRVQVSDLPPPASVPDRDILQRPGAPRRVDSAAAPTPAASGPAKATSGPASARAKTALELEVDRKRQAEEQEKAAKTKADEERRAAQRADNCQRARSMVATLESGQRVSRMNDKGEREFLDDAQRAAEVQRARSIMNSDCR